MSKPTPPKPLYKKPLPTEISPEMGEISPPLHPDYDRFIRISTVRSRIDVSNSTLYSWIAAGHFPKPIKIGRNSFWSENAINTWMKQQKMQEVA